MYLNMTHNKKYATTVLKKNQNATNNWVVCMDKLLDCSSRSAATHTIKKENRNVST